MSWLIVRYKNSKIQKYMVLQFPIFSWQQKFNSSAQNDLKANSLPRNCGNDWWWKKVLYYFLQSERIWWLILCKSSFSWNLQSIMLILLSIILIFNDDGLETICQLNCLIYRCSRFCIWSILTFDHSIGFQSIYR